MKKLYKNKTYKLWCPDCKNIAEFTEWLDSPGGYLNGVICGKCGSDRQMKNPSYYNCHVYKIKCKCGDKITVLTQDDDGPEYYSSVGVICQKCGDAVFFELPVN